MNEEAKRPEQRFLQAVFGSELAPRSLETALAVVSDAFLDELRERVKEALDTLSYRERGILEMRYGLGDGYCYTLAQAGEVFRLTRERIRQIQARSLRRLRLRAEELRDLVRELCDPG